MLMILTLRLAAYRFRTWNRDQSPSSSVPWSRRHEPRAAAGCRPRHSAPRVCGDGRLRARHRAVCRAEGDAAAPDRRLDLGRADAGGGDLLVLDPPDQTVRPVEPDPSAVDPHADHAGARRGRGADA